MANEIKITRIYPEFSDAFPISDRIQIEKSLRTLYDHIETIFIKIAEINTNQNNMSGFMNSQNSGIVGSSIGSPDPLLLTNGNLSADLSSVIAGVVPVTGKVTVRDSEGNSVNFLVG